MTFKYSLWTVSLAKMEFHICKAKKQNNKHFAGSDQHCISDNSQTDTVGRLQAEHEIMADGAAEFAHNDIAGLGPFVSV